MGRKLTFHGTKSVLFKSHPCFIFQRNIDLLTLQSIRFLFLKEFQVSAPISCPNISSGPNASPVSQNHHGAFVCFDSWEVLHNREPWSFELLVILAAACA